MDIKVLLRDSDARGALFYILNYCSKTETTMDALLNALAPVVERIKDESDGAPSAVIAAQMVRSCSCKTISQMNLGGPAAASKVLGYDDAKFSSVVHNPMAPLLAESSAVFKERLQRHHNLPPHYQRKPRPTISVKTMTTQPISCWTRQVVKSL